MENSAAPGCYICIKGVPSAYTLVVDIELEARNGHIFPLDS